MSPITMGSGGKCHAKNGGPHSSKICIYIVCMYDILISSNPFLYEEISPKRECKINKKLDNEVILEGFNFQ